MEEDQVVLKHACKFCRKSFPCGRSLGGHMRSHITNTASAETEEKLKTTTRKLSSLNNNGGSSSKVGEYDLRENPKKSWRFADSRSEETSLVTEDKFCKECGKAFHSWKALFGHMKCHSEKERASNNIEDQDSSSQKMVTDSQSDNEATANPNRRRRSKRRTRYMTVASTSSLSLANPSSSVSEVEQEQEEVAMSLMMLSRDVGHWGFNSLAESSDNNSAYFRTNLGTKIEREKVKSKGKKPEIPNGFKTTRPKVSINGFVKNCKEKKHELDFQSALEHSEDEEGKNDSELKSKCKRGKFKCTTCSKIFHSYQALGGHRASHKKMKGCSGSRNESSENSIETDLNNGYLVEQHDLIDNEEDTVTEPKKNKGHECPICLKVFPSGQALGGHKRSHLGGGSVILEEPPVQEIRDFLDLNLPAATEEESNSHGENYRPWWVVEGNSHKQEAPLLGLISN